MSHETHYCGIKRLIYIWNMFIFWIWILKPTSLKHHRIFPCTTAVSYNYSWDCMTTSYEKVLLHYYTWYFRGSRESVCMLSPSMLTKLQVFNQWLTTLTFNMGEFFYIYGDVDCERIEPLVNKCSIIVIKNAKYIHICQCKIKTLTVPHIYLCNIKCAFVQCVWSLRNISKNLWNSIKAIYFC